VTAPASASFSALGTTATLLVLDRRHIAAARALLVEELEAIDRSCSRFRPDSELSRVNCAGGRAVAVSERFLEALRVALRAARLTDGAVDPTVGRAMRAIGYDRDFDSISAARTSGAVVPGWQAIELRESEMTVRLPAGVELDLGATAKALAADRAAERIGRELRTGVLVSLGGDISTAGPGPDGGWQVAIADDHRDQGSKRAETVSIAAGGLATSSTTVRNWASDNGARHHIVDPLLGSSARVFWRTASVVAATCVDANTASTAAIIRGREAGGWLAAQRLPSRLVDRHGAVTRVGGWPQPSV
jgi:FAD:protein FMN transferase